MPKDSDRLRRGFEVEETGGALSGLLAEEDEFDRRTLWRLGTWAAVSVGAVVIALVTNQSSIGMRREQTAAADLMRQTPIAGPRSGCLSRPERGPAIGVCRRDAQQ
jgi:hypothetical protein